MGFKLAGGKGLREGWDSKELWKSVEEPKGEGGRNAYAILDEPRERRTLRPTLTHIPLNIGGLIPLLHAICTLPRNQLVRLPRLSGKWTESEYEVTVAR